MPAQDTMHRVYDKLNQLPSSRVVEVEDFIDFLNARQAGQTATRAAQQAAESTLTRIWDNDEDAEYDTI